MPDHVAMPRMKDRWAAPDRADIDQILYCLSVRNLTIHQTVKEVWPDGPEEIEAFRAAWIENRWAECCRLMEESETRMLERDDFQ